MKNKNKAVLLVVCVLCLAMTTVFGSLAYFTDTKTVTNTFTVGNVKIELDEADVNEYGVQDGVKRTAEKQTYKLIPNREYVKDPTVTVKGGSEDAYVRMIVTVNDIGKLKSAMPESTFSTYYGEYGSEKIFLLQNLCNGTWNEGSWKFYGYTTNSDNSVSYEFRKTDVVTRSDTDTKLDPLFTKIKVPGEVDNAGMENLKGVEITVVAHAVQAEGFTDAAEAWTAVNNSITAAVETTPTTP